MCSYNASMSTFTCVTGATAPGVVERERAEADLERRIADVCGVINAAAGRLVELVGEALDTGAWKGDGISSPGHYVAWKCGVSSRRARALVRMAERRPELAHTLAALSAGEISEDQAAVVAVKAPPGYDSQMAELARSATVSQLRRALSSYRFATPAPEPDPDNEKSGKTGEDHGAHATPRLGRRVSMNYDDDGRFRLVALLPAEEGAEAAGCQAAIAPVGCTSTTCAIGRTGAEPTLRIW